MRTEMVHLTNAFVRYCASARKLGYDTTDWGLTVGSKTQGNPYKVGVKGECGKSLPGMGDGDIGRTRGEAYDRLVTAANVLDDVCKHLYGCSGDGYASEMPHDTFVRESLHVSGFHQYCNN